MMKHVNLIQGSPEWLAYRRSHFNASDAPAMMGCSPYKTRSQLLDEMATGLAPEIEPETQRRFDEGHRAEALCRELAEQEIGRELYPVVGELGRYSASFDGLTIDEQTVFEHKLANAQLRAAVESVNDSANRDALPLAYRVQMEQQLMVSGALRCVFAISRWTREGELVEYASCPYTVDMELRAAIVAGWDQFAADLAAYVPFDKEAPAPTGRAPETLPALRVEVTGMVTASNLAEFKASALAVIGSVNRNLETDQDFADAERAVKWCSEVEERLAATKQHALSQTASIDELFRTMDDISAEARRVRLDLDKLVKARKECIRGDIVTDARMGWRSHIVSLEAELEGLRLALPEPDFAGAIKGKRSIDSLRDATATLLAQAKIGASERAGQLRASLTALREESTGFEMLFRDRDALVLKPADDVRMLARARITEHKAAEERRLEAERERIRAEERARAARIEAERIQREQAEAAQQERIRAQQAAADAIAQAAKNTPPQDSQQVLKAEPETADATARETPATTSPRAGAMGEGQAAGAAPAGAPQNLPNTSTCTKSQTDEPATLKLGAICERLGFTVTAAFLADVLKVAHRDTAGASKLYRESDFPVICQRLAQHIRAVAERTELQAA